MRGSVGGGGRGEQGCVMCKQTQHRWEQARTVAAGCWKNCFACCQRVAVILGSTQASHPPNFCTCIHVAHSSILRAPGLPVTHLCVYTLFRPAGLEPHSALPTALPAAFGLAGNVLPEGLRHRTHGLASSIVSEGWLQTHMAAAHSSCVTLGHDSTRDTCILAVACSGVHGVSQVA